MTSTSAASVALVLGERARAASARRRRLRCARVAADGRKVDSLNVSAAAAVLMYAAFTAQRG